MGMRFIPVQGRVLSFSDKWMGCWRMGLDGVHHDTIGHRGEINKCIHVAHTSFRRQN